MDLSQSWTFKPVVAEPSPVLCGLYICIMKVRSLCVCVCDYECSFEISMISFRAYLAPEELCLALYGMVEARTHRT
jgi:hypothetical protein